MGGGVSMLAGEVLLLAFLRHLKKHRTSDYRERGNGEAVRQGFSEHRPDKADRAVTQLPRGCSLFRICPRTEIPALAGMTGYIPLTVITAKAEISGR